MAIKLTTEMFIEKARAIHGDKYDYSKTIYINSQTKIIIICPIHGEFKQTPNAHLAGKSCVMCGITKTSDSKYLTTEEFIERARAIHGNKYDYNKTVYISAKNKVIIICPIHGEFEQTPSSHLYGSGCPKCGFINMASFNRLTLMEFIKKAREVHGNKYDYSEVNYINCNTDVIIICPVHGRIKQTPSNHILGSGCRYCGYIQLGKAKRLTTEEFIEKAKIVHSDKYHYGDTVFDGTKENLTVTCENHGNFEINAGNFLVGHGCSKCSTEKNSDKSRSNTEEFIKKAKAIHGDRYDYPETDYISRHKKVLIRCKVNNHGLFYQEAGSHLSGNGCPVCMESKGERIIRNILIKNNIKYITEYKIPLQKNNYRYDFYLPEYNLLIEYHGEQHYRAVNWFGGVENFNKQKYRDNIKIHLAKNLKYKILIIPFSELKNKSNEIFEYDLLEAIKKKIKDFPNISIPVLEKWFDS